MTIAQFLVLAVIAIAAVWFAVRLIGLRVEPQGVSGKPTPSARPKVAAPAPRRLAGTRPPFAFEVVGESHFQAALAAACHGGDPDGVEHRCRAVVAFDDDNPHDPNAVRVAIGGQTVAYLRSADAVGFRRQVAALGLPGAAFEVAALIVGGWDRGAGDQGSLGVKLDLAWPLRISRAAR